MDNIVGNSIKKEVKYYYTYKETAELLNISYDLIVKKHAPRIIELYKIDKDRMPKRSGLLPVWAVEEYFYLNKNSH